MEDTGTLQSLTFLANAHKVDLNRVLVLRTASNLRRAAIGSAPPSRWPRPRSATTAPTCRRSTLPIASAISSSTRRRQLAPRLERSHTHNRASKAEQLRSPPWPITCTRQGIPATKRPARPRQAACPRQTLAYRINPPRSSRSNPQKDPHPLPASRRRSVFALDRHHQPAHRSATPSRC